MSNHPVSHQNVILNAILESTVEGIVVCDVNQKLTYFNHRAMEFHGLPPGPIPPEEWPKYYGIYLPDGVTPYPAHEIPLIRALNDEVVKDVPMVISRPGKKNIHVMVTGEALFTPDGEKLGAMVSMLDITEMLEIQRTLAQLTEKSETRFQSFFEQAPFSIQLLNPEGESALVNTAWKKLWMRDGDGYNIFEDASLLSRGFEPQIRRAFNGEIVRLPEFQESGRWLRTMLYPIKSQREEVREVVVMQADITGEYQSRMERERLLSELNIERRRLDFLDHVTSLLLTSLDRDEIILQVAASAIPFMADGCIVDILDGGKIKRLVTRHRSPEEEQLMKEIHTQFPPNPQSSHPAVQVLKSGEPLLTKSLTNEYIQQTTQEEQHASSLKKLGIQSLIVVPIKIRDQVTGALTFINTGPRSNFDESDLTLAVELSRRMAIAIDHARLYAEAQSSVRQREDFISIASHELKTPITSLKLQLEAISLSISKDRIERIDHDYMKKFSSSAIKQLDRLTRLVEDMLDISRINTGRLALIPRVVDMEELLREVLSRFSVQLAEAKIELRSELAEDCLTYCDPFRIEQVINNLLSNAIKYGLGKPIFVKLERFEADLRVSVSDQGQGIKVEDQERVFQAFERGSDPNQVGGLGLGLFICREIIEQHQGKMTLTSSAGNGSTFSFTLPLETLN
jgi:signal transduction histidine kinase/PAS domain-containing protein